MTWLQLPPAEWVQTETDVVNMAQYLYNSAPTNGLGFDTETTGLDTVTDYAVLFSMSDGIRRFAGFAQPWLHHPWIHDALLRNPHIRKIGTNVKFDRHMCANISIEVLGPYEDTTVLDWLYDENRAGRHDLKTTAFDYCGLRMVPFTQVFNPRRGAKGVPGETAGEAIRRTMSEPDGFRRAIEYAGLDAFGSVHVRNELRNRLREIHHYPGMNLEQYFDEYEVPFSDVLWRIERRGFMVHVGHLMDQLGPIVRAMEEIEGEFASMVGRVVNLNSPKQLGKLFFEELGMPVRKKTKAGAPSVDEEVLQYWANTQDPKAGGYATLLLKHRGMDKIKGTYIDGLIEAAGKDASMRIHTTLNQHGTVTGRLSSKEPNLQNIPRVKTDKFKIRNAFIASPGKTLVVADYDQLEMKIMAHFSEDPQMIAAIRGGQDLHCFTVSLMFGIPYDQVYAAKKAKEPTPEQEALLLKRQAAKSIGFGLIYGIGSMKLGQQLTEETGVLTDVQEAARLIKRYFAAFPGVDAFIKRTHESCRRTEKVQTLLGRYRRLPEINSRGEGDEGVAAQARRQSVNTIIQGTAADIAKVAMMISEYDGELNQLGAELLMQIHDELIFEVEDKPEIVARTKQRVQDIMQHPFAVDPFLVPMTCEAKAAHSWAEAKG